MICKIQIALSCTFVSAEVLSVLSLQLILVEVNISNKGLISFEYSVESKFVLKYTSTFSLLVAFCFDWIACAFRRLTDCFLENLSWFGCLQTKSFWQYPFLYLLLFLLVSRSKHWRQWHVYWSSANGCFCIISITVLQEKYWIIFMLFGQLWQHNHPLHKRIHCYQLHEVLVCFCFVHLLCLVSWGFLLY